MVVSALFILRYAQSLRAMAKTVLYSTSRAVVSVASQALWTPMIKDEFGHVNVLLMWYGWGSHQGAFLTDSIMIASYDEKRNSVSLLSLPRDILVFKNKQHWYGKVNSYFNFQLWQSDNMDEAAIGTIQKMEEMFWIKIPYYTLIDFKWFESVVDALWGIEVNVPQILIDNQYPIDRNGTYTTVRFNSGLQYMNGESALIYARSRHSTSDFSRSRRQHDVIKAIIQKALKTENLTNLTVLRSLYSEYSSKVTTNITYQHILGLVSKIDRWLPQVISNGLTSECGYGWYKMMKPWCLLYTPPSELVGWASALIPNGATVSNPSNYKYLQNYAFFVLHNQGYQIERPSIEVVNGIGTNAPRSRYISRWSAGIDMAVKLKKFNFVVEWSRMLAGRNSKEFSQDTVVRISGSGDQYPETLKALSMILDYDRIETWAILSWFNMQIVLGNTYVQKYGDKIFNRDM